MTRLRWGLFVAATSAGLLGCETKSGPGGPGATRKPDTTATQTTDRTDTFKLSVPAMKTDLDRGEPEEVTISIDRGSNFNEAVRLEFRAPEGVTVNPTESQIPAGEDKTKVTIQAGPDAPAGDTSIEVTAVPETGAPVSARIPIQIAQRN